MKNLAWLLLTGVILLGVVGADAGTIWNVAEEFSTAGNPNGAWSYGTLVTYSETSREFVPFSTPDAAAADGSTFAAWHDEDWNVNGKIGENLGPNPIDEWGWYCEVGQVLMGSPLTVRSTTIRWTAPADMTVDVSAMFSGQDTDGTESAVYVLLNNTTVYSGYVSGFIGRAANGYADAFGATPNQSYSCSGLEVSVGDVVYFAMYGMGYTRHTSLTATVTEVPEPMTLSLLGLGGVLCVVRRKK